MFAEVLQGLGTRRAFIVHGYDGMDEITCTGPTRVCELRDGQIKTYDLNPEMLIGECCDACELEGGTPTRNAARLLGVLEGSDVGGGRKVVLLNAAAAIVAGEKADDLAEGIKLAERSIDSGAALAKLNTLIEESHQ